MKGFWTKKARPQPLQGQMQNRIAQQMAQAKPAVISTHALRTTRITATMLPPPDAPYANRLTTAVALYKQRNLEDYKKQALATMAQPQGHKDRVGRWWPNPIEVAACCREIAMPHPNYPWTLHRHCRSAKHIAMLNHVSYDDLVAQVMNPRRRHVDRCAECSKFVKSGHYKCERCV